MVVPNVQFVPSTGLTLLPVSQLLTSGSEEVFPRATLNICILGDAIRLFLRERKATGHPCWTCSCNRPSLWAVSRSRLCRHPLGQKW